MYVIFLGYLAESSCKCMAAYKKAARNNSNETYISMITDVKFVDQIYCKLVKLGFASILLNKRSSKEI